MTVEHPYAWVVGNKSQVQPRSRHEVDSVLEWWVDEVQLGIIISGIVVTIAIRIKFMTTSCKFLAIGQSIPTIKWVAGALARISHSQHPEIVAVQVHRVRNDNGKKIVAIVKVSPSRYQLPIHCKLGRRDH